jgi:hypothetical protein
MLVSYTLKLLSGPKQPSSVVPSPSPTLPAVPPRSSYGLMLTSYDLSCGLSPSLPSLAAIPSEHSPISLFEPAPFSAAKPPILFASVGLCCGLFPNRSTTQSLKSLGLTFLPATVPLGAQHEAAEARWLDLTLFPLGI